MASIDGCYFNFVDLLLNDRRIKKTNLHDALYNIHIRTSMVQYFKKVKNKMMY